jgi:hypothetical protein
MASWAKEMPAESCFLSSADIVVGCRIVAERFDGDGFIDCDDHSRWKPREKGAGCDYVLKPVETFLR